MASEKARRDIHIKGVAIGPGHEGQSLTLHSQPAKVGGLEFSSGGMQQEQMQKQEGTEERKAPSLEEIAQQRATAQQNSMDALTAAEERYQKAKELGASALHDAKESASHGLGAAGYYATAKGVQAKDSVTHGVQIGPEYVADKAGAAKDTTLDKGQQPNIN